MARDQLQNESDPLHQMCPVSLTGTEVGMIRHHFGDLMAQTLPMGVTLGLPWKQRAMQENYVSNLSTISFTVDKFEYNPAVSSWD